MSIRITRNESGNCITFVGSSNPAYWNACLSAQINADDSSRIDIINDIRSANDPETQYEFYAVNFSDFADSDGNSFADAQAAVDYINTNANVVGVSSTGTDLTGVSVNFRLDSTSTSIIMDNGSSFGVNTIKAVVNADGTIHIHAIGAGLPSGAENANNLKHFEKLQAGNVSVNGTVVPGGVQTIANTLNELFTVGAFESVVISDPYSTMVADVDGIDAGYALVGADAVDPVGDDIFTYDGSGYANYAGLKSTATIDQPGEYFTFDIRGEGTIGFGLVHTQSSFDDGYYSGNANYANPANFAAVNSAHYGFQFSHWFHPTPNGSWTNYGASTGYVGGPGWSNWDQQQDWLDGNPVKIRCGIDSNGYISIESLQDDGTWVVHARSNYPVIQDSEFHLGIKSQSTSARVYTAPKVHLLEAAAPTMYFRYIESPDGNFEYPLFATEEEANYYHKVIAGVATGTSHTHTYDDDPTNTTWYMPTNGQMAGTNAPSSMVFDGNQALFTEITSLTDSDLAPTAFGASNITQQEGTNVNIQVTPAGATWSTSVSITPSGSGLVYDGSSLIQGTLSDVGSDTVYTIQVTRANSYGSSVGSMTVTATDVAPVQTNLTPWTKALDFSGSNEHLKQVSSNVSYNPLRMNGLSTQIPVNANSGKTTNSTTARPWATAVVFKADRNNSNQHIWNSGEGSGTNADNIYLRLTAAGSLMFGWGREGVGYNECRIADQSISSSVWYGVYIAHKGYRASAAAATSNNLPLGFDIRLMSSADSFNAVGSDLSVSANWTSTGARMDRAVIGDFTIGGRGSNRNFHGQVASMVITNLRINQNIPTDAEIKLMITDPKKWEDDYRDGQLVRGYNTYVDSIYDPDNWQGGGYTSNFIWLMGDGSSDSYANGIRNEVYPSDQNTGKLQLNSMVSNDIQNVTIPGLT